MAILWKIIPSAVEVLKRIPVATGRGAMKSLDATAAKERFPAGVRDLAAEDQLDDDPASGRPGCIDVGQTTTRSPETL